MTNITNSKTLCCSITCEKRFECGRADINNIGTYCVEDYSRFGTGIMTNNGCKIEYWCGELGDYRMFEPIDKARITSAVSKGLFDQIKWERDVALEQLKELGLGLGEKIDGVYLTKEDYDKLLEYKYMYEDLCR